MTADGSTFRFEAHAGEANVVEISVSIPADATGEVRITDTGAMLTATGDCRSLDSHSAACVVGGEIVQDERFGPSVLPVTLKANLGDGADIATMSGSALIVYTSLVRGGSGGDSISLADFITLGDSPPLAVLGDSGIDTLVGGAGSDHLEGGEGDDAISAGAGYDGIAPGPGADRIDGGPDAQVGRGRVIGDQVIYDSAPRGIVGNLTTGIVSGWGHDRLTDVEDIFGSRYADVLIGNAEANDLGGLGGNDRIWGRGGNDGLFGDGGADRLDAGPGNDYVDGDLGRDVLRGGRGRDHLEGSWGNDRLFGGREADHIVGDLGSDLLVGGVGRDLLRGGTGADTLDARDGSRDAVGGGRGVDRACVDRRLDRLILVEILRCAAGLTG